MLRRRRADSGPLRYVDPDGNANETAHFWLGIASFIPVVGQAASLVEAGLYAVEGDYVAAAFSAAGAIPGGKLAATGIKAGVEAVKLVQTAARVEKAVVSTEKAAAKLGGAYKDLAVIAGKEERHHMFSTASLKDSGAMKRREGPAIVMDVADHQKTGSWGNSAKAQRYRMEEAALLKKGDYLGAFEKAVDDIRANFGNKYEAAIAQAREELISRMTE